MQAPSNLEYFPLDGIKSMNIFKPKALDRVPFQLVAKMVETSEQIVVYILKQIVMAVENTLETGYTNKLNLRIGLLRFTQDGFQFINNGQGRQNDSVSQATSSNTEFRVNKRYLTNLRDRPGDYDRETVFSTVKDALSNISSATPKSRQRIGFFSPAPGMKSSGAGNPTSMLKKATDVDSMFSASAASQRSRFHAANPNPQATAKERFLRPNLAEFQEKVHTKHGATGLPGIVSPNYPDDKFGRRVIFNTDKTTRRDIQNEIDATRDAVYAQLLANRESKKQSKEDLMRQE